MPTQGHLGYRIDALQSEIQNLRRLIAAVEVQVHRIAADMDQRLRAVEEQRAKKPPTPRSAQG